MSKEQVNELLIQLRQLRGHISDMKNAVEICLNNGEQVDTKQVHQEILAINNEIGDILALAVDSL
jgi:hypothetical protein